MLTHRTLPSSLLICLVALLAAAESSARCEEAERASKTKSPQRLIDDLNSEDAPGRKGVADKLVALGEEVRARAREVISEIGVRAALAEFKKDGGTKFLRRMVSEKTFPTDERWQAIYRLAGQ